MRRRFQRGSALLVALILTAVVAGYVISNCVALSQVRQYLQHIEQNHAARLQE